VSADTRRPLRPTRQVATQFHVVAIPAAIALAAVGAIAAEHVHLPWIVGAAGGAIAALLTVLALPSLPTRRATIVLLGIGGLGALRHASFAGNDRSWLLVVWAAATLVTLVLVDRADAETSPALAGGAPLPSRTYETLRVSAIVALVVAVAAVALVPTVTARLGRHVWPGLVPNIGNIMNAPTSLRASNHLDLTTRPELTDAVVFTVDASHADFWRGETYDVYNGSSWTRSAGSDEPTVLDRDGNTVTVLPAPNDVGAANGTDFRQTFHIETAYSGVVFAAPSPHTVETDKTIEELPDGTVRAATNDQFGDGIGFGKGAVYTVVSRSMQPTEASLRAADAQPVPAAIRQQYADPAGASPQVQQLAKAITAGRPTTFDKIKAIEAWMGEHTQYSLNAPTSSSTDVVTDFLFHTKLGWCEQIASSLVLLARSAGIPARLVTGFAPGSADALTGRFVVREKDAHAWAEVFFPGIGWQGFDPTASVPLAGDAHSNGSWLETARHHAVAFAVVIALLALLIGATPELRAAARRRRARRASWSASTLHRLERIGRKAGRARAPAETPREYARALAERLRDDRLVTVGEALDRDAYSSGGAPHDDRAAAEAVLTSL